MEVLTFLQEELPDDALVGMDLGISLPFADRGAFSPAGHRVQPRLENYGL